MSIGVDSIGEATIGHPVETGAPPPTPTTTLLQMINHLRFGGNYFALLLVLLL